MTPSARISAIIDLLGQIEQPGTHANKTISKYFRNRRYIGSKDRRAISDSIFNILRHHARLLWWTNDGIARLRTIASLVLLDRKSQQEVIDLFNGDGYAPPSLTPSELKLLKSCMGKSVDDPSMPLWLSSEVPEWLLNEMQANWPLDLIEETNALNQPAPIDIRVNTLKASRDNALMLLNNDGIKAKPTPFSPIGLRIHGRVNLQITTAFKGGFIELQDEGSQLISFLVDAKVGQKTIDFCAGGGGKTLALAALMNDGGPLIACDVNSFRLNKMHKRLKRAGVTNVTPNLLTGLSDPWIEKTEASAHRVLLDTPCSGSGSWRRSPANKWQLTREKLKKNIERQTKIIDTASKLVKPGGRLIYSTCSVLQGENEEQIERFLEENRNFDIFPIPQLWDSVLDGHCPTTGPYLNLTPARHYTDGFFCAVLKRMS